MTAIRQRVFETIELAKANALPKEDIFEVSDPGVPDRHGFVPARTHPVARGAASLAWGMVCSTVGSKGKGIRTLADVKAAVASFSAEDKAALLLAIQYEVPLAEQQGSLQLQDVFESDKQDDELLVQVSKWLNKHKQVNGFEKLSKWDGEQLADAIKGETTLASCKKHLIILASML